MFNDPVAVTSRPTLAPADLLGTDDEDHGLAPRAGWDQFVLVRRARG